MLEKFLMNCIKNHHHHPNYPDAEYHLISIVELHNSKGDGVYLYVRCPICKEENRFKLRG